MNTAGMLSLVEDLEDNLGDLEDSLDPLLKMPLSSTMKKLPLLDRAKLNVVTVYAIESLLFSYLKLQGTDVLQHPVYKELTRIKQYFQKIKAAEEGQTKSQPTLTLNKQAAGRILKYALAGNDKIDLERAEREAKERLLAKRKLRDLEATMKLKAQENENVPLSTILQTDEQVDREEGELSDDGEQEQEQEVSISDLIQEAQNQAQAHTSSQPAEKDRKRKRNKNDHDPAEDKSNRKAKKQAKKQAKREAQAAGKTQMPLPRR